MRPTHTHHKKMPGAPVTRTMTTQAGIDWGYCGRGANIWDGKAAAVVGSGGGAGTGESRVTRHESS